MGNLDKGQSHEDSNTSSDFENCSSYVLEHRLKISAYLNSIAFNYDFNNPPRMDKTVFKCGKIDE